VVKRIYRDFYGFFLKMFYHCFTREENVLPNGVLPFLIVKNN